MINLYFQRLSEFQSSCVRVILFGFPSISHMYPLVNVYIAIENGPVEIVDLPINSMVIFHRFFVNV